MKFFLIQILLPVSIAHGLFAKASLESERFSYARSLLDEGFQAADSVKMLEGYYLLAKREMSVINYAEAYRLFFEGLKISESIGDYYKTGKILLRLSDLEMKLNNLEKAKAYTYDAIKIFKDNDSQKGLRSAYLAAGNIYASYVLTNDTEHVKENADRAFSYFRQVEEMGEAYTEKKDLAGVKFTIGRLYLKLGMEEAIPYLRHAVELLQEYPPNSSLITFQTALANAWIMFGEPMRARDILSHSQSLLGSLPYIHSFAAANHHAAYSDYYKCIGDWEEALFHGEKAIQIYHLMAEADREENTNRWRVQLETEKKDLALKLQNQEVESKQRLIYQQQLFLGIFGLCFMILNILSFFLYKNFKKQKSLSQKNAVLIQEQSHRVKNNLQVVSSMLNLQQDHLPDKFSKGILSESRTRIDSMILLHRQLYENDSIGLIDTENFFQDLIDSVARTFGTSKLHSTINMGVKYLKTDAATAMGIVINELVVNSFKHAFKEEVSAIEISSKQSKDLVQIMYKDFGNTDLGEIINDPAKRGFGLDLIEMILFQINGSLEYTHQGGSIFTISFTNQ